MKKEQSSILMPKNDLVGVKKSEKKEEAKIPKPTGWRILVLPFKMKEKSKGGLHFAEATVALASAGVANFILTVSFGFSSV